MTMSTSLVQKVIANENGEITVLRPRTLREIIADNPDLLEKFNNDPKKHIKMKEYLSVYSN